MFEPGWISFHAASAVIRNHFGGSQADAEATLRRAGAAERIRSMKAPCDPEILPMEFWTPLAPNDWRERQPDHDGPDTDGCQVIVMVNEDDFRHWLNAEPKPAADNRRDAVIRGLLETGKRPPDNISWKEFCKKVRDLSGGWIKDKPAHGFSEKQIKRVVKMIEATVVKKPKRLILQRVDK